MARAFPGSVKPECYLEFVALYLNAVWAGVANTIEASEAVEIGVGSATIPNEWIDTITDDPVERAKWRLKEFKKER